MHPTVAPSDVDVLRVMLAVACVLAHCAVKGSGSNVLSVPYSSSDALTFSSELASLKQGHRIKTLSANNRKFVTALWHGRPLRVRDII